MATTSFSALMPSVLRIVNPGLLAAAHVPAGATVALADWGGCFRTEDDVERMLAALERLLVLLSIAGYGVPEVSMAAAGVPQADVVSVSTPTLEIRRGTVHEWLPAGTPRIGLRVCPTTPSAVDLAAALAAYAPGFAPTACGWLMLPLDAADPVSSLDELVRDELWPALVGKVAAGSVGVGVAVLVDAALAAQIPSVVPVSASLPELASRARDMLKAAGASAVLEAEFDAEDGGPTLSEQFQALRGAAGSLVTRVVDNGVLATTSEMWNDYWHADEPADEPVDAVSLGAINSLGILRALLSWIGCKTVVDTGSASAMPLLTRLMDYRRQPDLARNADWSQLPFVRRKSGAAEVDTTLEGSFVFKVSADWDEPAKAFVRATENAPLVHTLDFGRTRFEMEHAARDLPGWEQDYADKHQLGTVYLLPAASYRDRSIFPAYLPAADDTKTGAGEVRKSLSEGAAPERRFWCSALTMWTLAAAGYDLKATVKGSDGQVFAYSEGPGKWTPIDLYMLLNPLLEAGMALALVLQEQRGAVRDPVTGWTSWPLLAALPARVADFGAKTLGPIELVDGKARRKAEGGVPIVLNSKGKIWAFVYKEFFDPSPEHPGRNFDDNPAVMGAPGALMVLGLGHRVAYQDIRPGDIGQRFSTNADKSKSPGGGHSFQVWSVMVTGSAPAGEGPAFARRVQDPTYGAVLILTKDTDPAGVQVTRTVKYQVLEANTPNQQLGLDVNGGVTISEWNEVPAQPAQGEAGKESVPNRWYFARLHENPWSASNRALPAGQSESPLACANLMRYRRSPDAAKSAPWSQMRYVRQNAGAVGTTLQGPFTFKVSPDWDEPAQRFKRATESTALVHTLDFGRTRFEMEHAARDLPGWEQDYADTLQLGTVYLLPSKGYRSKSIFPAYLPAADDTKTGAGEVRKSLSEGAAPERRFWCSALTMWTLAAAGYDLKATVKGSDGQVFAYSEGPGKWTPIDLYMLLNPLLEAGMALALVLQEQRGAVRDPVTGWTSWPLLAALPARVADFGAKTLGPIELVDGKARRKAEGGVPIVLNSKGKIWAFVYKEFFDPSPEHPGRNFDDNPAVMGAPGALMVLGLGHRVAYQDIRPGDIGQRFSTNADKSKSPGGGHSFQVWSVMVTGSAPAGEGPAFARRVQDPTYGAVLILTKDTDPAGVQVTRTVKYQVLEANTPNQQLGLDVNGGVTISEWNEVPAQPAQGEAGKESVPNRWYFARLHENPWSDARLTAVDPANAP